MKKLFFVPVVFLVCMVCSSNAQTVVEMMHPDDADVTLLVVNDIKEADLAVYRTTKKAEFEEWDWMWRFKKGGFSNFKVYLTKNENDPLLSENDEGVKRIFSGKVYFTENKEERGIKTEGFRLEGVMMVKRKIDEKKSKKKKK